VSSPSSVAQERFCVVCTASLAGHRSHARHCSGACRAEASRIRAILSGDEALPWRSLKERRESAHRDRVGLWEGHTPVALTPEPTRGENNG
jgi:hypothetical protein